MGIHSRNILDVFAKLIRALECPVCYDYVSSPIWQCNAGHIICGSCKNKISSCPTCRQSFSSTRVRSLEQISDIMIFPCLNEGCEQMLPLNEIHSHEARCTLSGARGNLDGEAKAMVVQYNILKHIENNIAPFFVTTNNNRECETVKTRRDASTSTSDFLGFVKAVDPSNKIVERSTSCSSIMKIDRPKDSHQPSSNVTIKAFHFNSNVDSSYNISKVHSRAKNYYTRHITKRKVKSPEKNIFQFFDSSNIPASCSNLQTLFGNPQASESNVCNFLNAPSVSSTNSLLSGTYQPTIYKSVFTCSKMSTDTVPTTSIKPTFEVNMFSASNSVVDSHFENNSPVSITPCSQNIPIRNKPPVSNEDPQFSDIISTTSSPSFSSFFDNNNVESLTRFRDDITNDTTSSSGSLVSQTGLPACQKIDNTKTTTSNINASVLNRRNENKDILENMRFTFNNNITISTSSPCTPTTLTSRNMISGIDTSSIHGTTDLTSSSDILCKDIHNTNDITSHSLSESAISMIEYFSRSKNLKKTSISDNNCPVSFGSSDNAEMSTDNSFFTKLSRTHSSDHVLPRIQPSSALDSTGNSLSSATDSISFENLIISSKNRPNIQTVEQQQQPFKMYRPNETICFKFCKPNESLQKPFGIFQFQG